jgi:tetratricopeptide (TPR) repeat protein
MALVAVAGFCAAQEKPADAKPQRQFATAAEYELASSIDKEPTPAGRLQKLEQWKKEYPTTNFADVRRRGFLVAYSQLGRPRDAFNAALDILKEDNPNDELALRTVLAMIQGIQGPTPDEYQTAIRIAQQIVNNADVIYAADKKPTDQSDAQWSDLKKAMRPYAQKTIGWVYFVQKDLPKSEAELKKALEMDPTQAATAYLLAQAYFGQRTEHPEKQVPALFYFARAAAYDGPNSLDANTRAQIKRTFSSYYKQYHGSPEGENEVLALAKNNGIMPANFTIVDIGTINQKKAMEEQEKRLANPMITMWTDIKKELTTKGDEYFNESVKEKALPTFKGKLISMKPAIRPKEIVLAIEKPDVADLTVKLDEGQVLPGKMEPGAEIEVAEGVGSAYTKDPYMLTITADKAKITGWVPAKVAPAPGKKAAPKKK